MSKVVGTAYVQIRALTNNLAKEIEAGIKKGMKDAKLDTLGKEAGNDFGENLADGAESSLKKRAKNIVPRNEIVDQFDDVRKEVERGFGQISFDLDNIPEFNQLEFGFDEAKLQSTFDRIKAKFRDTDFSDGLGDLFKGFTIDVSGIDAELQGLGGSFDSVREKIAQNETESRSWFSRLRERMRRFSLDTDDKMSKPLDRLAKSFRDFGKGADLPGIGRLGKTFGLLGGAVAALLPSIQDLGSGILAYLTGLLAQVGFIATAVVGSVAAIGAAIGSSLLAVAPIALAFTVETQLLEDFKDVLKETGEEFQGIGVATQQTLLPALQDSLGLLDDLVPMFSEFGLFVGAAVGGFARYAAEVLTGTVAQGRFADILRSSLRILDLILPTILNFGDILSGIWVAAIPASERFVENIATLVERWSDLVNQGLRSGALTDALNTWYERAQILGSALSNLSGAIFDIFEAGGDSADGVFRSFDAWAERFRRFTESEVGQNKLKLIFDNSLAVMREVNGVVADLFDGIFGRLGEIGGVDGMVESLQRLREEIPRLQEHWANMLETIEPIAKIFASNIWEKFQQAFEELREPVGRLVHQIVDLLEAMEESGAFDLFLDLLKILADTLSTLLSIPGFGTFIGYFIAFSGALKVARVVLGPFTTAFGGFLTLISNMVKIKAGVALADTAGGLSSLAAGFAKAKGIGAAGPAIGQGVAAVGASAAGTASHLGGVIGGLTGMSAALPIAGAALAVGAGLFFKMRQESQKWDQEIRQATESLGLLNGGLNITADGIQKYIEEQSRFNSRDQLDDLGRMGVAFQDLAAGIADGTASFSSFIDQAIQGGEIDLVRLLPSGEEQVLNSFSELGTRFGLTQLQLENLWETGRQVTEDGVEFLIGGNTSLGASFIELNKVIGASVKENIDAFVTNAENVRLLGPEILGALSLEIEDLDDEEAVAPMRRALDQLGEAAREDSAAIAGLSAETRRMVREQAATAGDAIAVAVEENRLLRVELEKQNLAIREDFNLFSSAAFRIEFREARLAVLDFSDVVENTDLSGFNLDAGIEPLADNFRDVGVAAQNLFSQLSQLPEEEFNAAARVMGADADTLRDAMQGAMESISALQDAAVATLPTVGSLLNEATGATEDGTPTFNRDQFITEARQRITDTESFGTNIERIRTEIGEEAARMAAQEGPVAAANLASFIGHGEDELASVLAQMEVSEEALRTQISASLGPAISAEYLAQSGLAGTNWSIGLANGISSPEAYEALRGSAVGQLDFLARGFQGRFTLDPSTGRISFEHTGVFNATAVTRPPSRGGSRTSFSQGGYVGTAPTFNGGPSGTDTVNAWLTPGEFVLRRAVAQSIPSKILNSLNSGDPRILGLLSSLNRNRPTSPAAALSAAVASVPSAGQGPGLVIQQMNIEAPTPLEASRQIATRLRIAQAQAQPR